MRMNPLLYDFRIQMPSVYVPQTHTLNWLAYLDHQSGIWSWLDHSRRVVQKAVGIRSGFLFIPLGI